MHYNELESKFFVPNATYSVKSRLDWLAGFLDADGCVYRNGTNEALTASSVNKGVPERSSVDVTDTWGQC